MKRYDWRSVAELIGIAAVVASLIFVGFQLRQEQDIAQSQLFADWDDTRIEWSRLLSENNDVWIRGLAGSDLTINELLVFESLADAWFHMENGRFVRANRITSIDTEGLGLRVAAFLLDNPGLRGWWNERWTYRREMGIGSPSFVGLVERLIEEMESGKRKHIERKSVVPM